ncbi:acyl carrier protein [Peptoniphilus asaccharolyticus DSM 20463]|uniref:Acyl carrier protein n=1 Tax=Peptoniphilus asaccharolyticus DSM 20463 TaxID=573058 RepID=A0A1W1UXL4_PEPAS|nr:acyl carrier protein [Peptoniphilus asaccharolyticus]MBL7575314.1 acyl carrier protein [Peptoniphilus asaccharolyticus]SMB85823.1 acyl carrier protein [Peptoniphilus asaccharolyticus DSM 20463]
MTFEELKNLICENFGNDMDEITESANLQEDLGLDSLDAVELSMAIEEKYNAEIPDEDFAKFITVGDVFKYINDKN